jgi:hypothetical protein
LEGEPAAEEALLYTLRERPRASDQLLVLPRTLLLLLQVRGLGLEGEPAAEEALLYTLRERPRASDQLLVLPRTLLLLLQVRGLGLEGEPAAEEALLYTLRERPGAPDQLLVGSRPAALVQLAGLAESCDWVADCLQTLAAAAAGALCCFCG